MKNILLLIVLLFVGETLRAQADNPYAEFGYEGKVLKTPQERQQYMLTIPNPNSSSDIALVGIAPNEGKYYLFDKDNELLDEDTLMNNELGRFLSIDPLHSKYPELTTYQFASNTPIQAIDLDGLEAFFIHGTNHGPDAWESELNIATQDELYSLTNNTYRDNNFSWKVPSTQTETSRWNGKEVPRTKRLLNHQTNGMANRQEAAQLLVDYVLNFREENYIWGEQAEEITLIGYSHGGNVSIMAADILFEEHGLKVNIITINTPAFNKEGDPENPLENSGINDMITLWTQGDGVAGGVSPGSSDYTPENEGGENTPRNRVFRIKERNEVGGLLNNHYLENVDSESIQKQKIEKLKPVSNGNQKQ